MATLDALSASPTATLAAMLLRADTHLQHLLYPNLPIVDTQAPNHSNAIDDLSSSDKENSPSYALQKSSQVDSVDPHAKSALQLSPTTSQMSFTPQRTRPPPRAWERRPATPFVPRNEGQRIWKRVPLQELGVEVNQQVSRREKEEKENYLRVIKRLRLDTEGGATVIADSDGSAVAAGTRWEEENIEKHGSPKKKARMIGPDSSTLLAKSTKELPLESEDSVPAKADEESGIDSVAGRQPQTPQVLADQLDKPAQEPRQLEQPNTEVLDSDGVRQNEGHDNVEVGGDIQQDAMLGAGIAVTDCSHETVTVTNGIETSEATPGAENRTTFLSNEGLDRFNGEASSDYEVATNAVLPQVLELQVTTSHDWPNMDTDPIIDEKLLENQELPDFEPCTLNTSTVPLTVQKSISVLATDQDETAFLRDFLERAQASKAARFVSSPQKKPVATLSTVPGEHEYNVTVLPPDYVNETVDDIEDDDLSPPLETTQVEQILPDTNMVVSSPTRRSARNAARASSGRVSRYQTPPTSHLGTFLPSQQAHFTLPNTIQLKRATGNEFIFNAKLQQNLVMITRSNTKRNQADAVHVPQRLAQLKKEYEALQREDSVEEKIDPPAAGAIEDDEEAKSTNKKRKRDRQDIGKSSKMKRKVRWSSDEKLVCYREPSPFVTVEAGESSENKVESSPSLIEHIQTEDTSETAAIVEAQPNAELGTRSTRANSSVDSSKLKVRRIRKIKLDSVNGTPAPKTRSRSIPDSETVDTEASTSTSAIQVQPSTAISAKTGPTSTRKSSRMPVPISTPIPLPSLNDAKTKPKPSTSDKEKSKIAALTKSSSNAGLPDQTRASEQQASDSAVLATSTVDRKLDGRRKLRVRDKMHG